MREFVALLLGYLLGSVLPADLLARARRIDIRAVGTRNPGTSNALAELGVVPGLITAVYDVSVGVVAMIVAWRLGLAEPWIYLAGLLALLGHVFPVFSRFRGGQGMAASAGMVIFGTAIALVRGWLTVLGILMLAVLAVGVLAGTRRGNIVGIVVVPLLALELAARASDWQFVAFMTGLCVWIVAVQVAMVRAERPWLGGPLGKLAARAFGGRERV
jgi:acyl-phosphate glycerol 3-phosphate acyltransferase